MNESILYIVDKSGKFTNERYLKKNHNELYLDIIKYSNNNNFYDISFKEKIYYYKLKLTNRIFCQNENCNNFTNFINNNVGYRKYCSKKCCANDIKIKEKHKITNLKKYGVENVFQIDIIKKQIINTNLEKYGVENPQQNINIKEKTHQTNLKKYGVKYILQNKYFKDKSINTNLERYGIEIPSKLDSIKEKTKLSNIKKYGIDNPSKLDSIKEKTKLSNIKKYGIDNPSKLDSVKEKIVETNLEKYGINYPLKLDYIKEKGIVTNLNRYGVQYTSQSNEYKIKRNKTYVKNMFNKIDNLIDIDTEHNYIIKCDCNENHTYITNNKLYYQRKNSNTIQCTICNPIDSGSGLELMLLNFIKENYKEKIETNKRNIISPYELDIYLPDLNLAFEFNGVYWHNELYKDKNYHKDKTDLCSGKGIDLIHIYEDDWLYKQDIVKSMILNKLCKNNNRVFARNTEIKEISDNELVKIFLNDNHLQGFVGSNIKIGLYYNNELVSLMTFGKLRKIMNSKSKNDNEYEMLRFCNKLNTSVTGGASKLFKYFIKKYNPTKIISYADKGYSNGNLYKKLNFNDLQETQPNYYYVVDGFKKHRFGFRKDVLIKQGFDKNKSEHDIMLERKIYRIYNSGNFKFIYKT